MRKWAWVLVLLLVGTLYFLSSIPGLRVLPVLSTIHSFMNHLDVSIVRISHGLASRLPLNPGELKHIDTVTADFLAYARENPVIIEFLLRKLAHIVIFFIITIALFFLFHQYIRNSALAVGLSFLTATGIAGLDEYRQSFVDGRVGSLIDVFINVIGITLATGLIAFALFLTRAGRHKFIRSSRQEIESNDDPPTRDEPRIPEQENSEHGRIARSVASPPHNPEKCKPRPE